MPNLVGPGLIGAAGPTSTFYTTPYPHKPGDKARDKDGNEYVFCDLTAVIYRGCLAQISSVFGASPLLGAANTAMRVGVFVGGDATTVNNATSDNGGWFQIYGLHQAVQTGTASGGLSSDNTVAYSPIVQSSVGTPSGTLSLITVGTIGTSIAVTSSDGIMIYGLWVVPNVNTANVDATSDIQSVAANLGSAVSSWPVSGASGPCSLDPDPGNTAAQGMLASGTNTSGFIGSTYVCFLNYPYVHGIVDQLPGLTGT